MICASGGVPKLEAVEFVIQPFDFEILLRLVLLFSRLERVQRKSDTITGSKGLGFHWWVISHKFNHSENRD